MATNLWKYPYWQYANIYGIYSIFRLCVPVGPQNISCGHHSRLKRKQRSIIASINNTFDAWTDFNNIDIYVALSYMLPSKLRLQ